MEEEYYENGEYRGRKISDGYYLNKNGVVLAKEDRDGTIYDFKTGSSWRRGRRSRGHIKEIGRPSGYV